MAAWVLMAHGCYLRPVTCMTYQKLSPKTREYLELCAGRLKEMFLGSEPVKAPPGAE